MYINNWHKANEFLADKKTLVIISHVNPDGDAIGSQLGVFYLLKEMGKTVKIINHDACPEYLMFLDGAEKIEQYNSTKHDEYLKSCDAAIILDANTLRRLGDIGTFLSENPIPFLYIDHHPQDLKNTHVQFVNDKASCTGELIFEWIKETGINIDAKITNALYVSVITDTGNFRFSNTNAITFRFAAELIDNGAQSHKIYSEIYENDSPGRMALLGQAINSLHFDCDGKLAWFTISQKMLNDCSAEFWEIEGFSDLPRKIKGVEVGILFTEKTANECKISFRSTGAVKVNSLAEQFGGGGHKFAAGASLNSTLENAIEQILTEAKKIFM